MLAETSKRTAEGSPGPSEGVSTENGGPPRKVPKVNPAEHVIIILDDDSDTDKAAPVTLPHNEPPPYQTVTCKSEPPSTTPQDTIPFTVEPLLPFHSNTNMYFAAANNTTQSNFDPEIFDMQLTAQGSFLSIAILHGFTTKRIHKKAAKRRI